MEGEIFEYLYKNFDSGSTWEENLKDLMNSKEFQGKTKKEIRFFLRKMENEGFLKTSKIGDDEYITVSLKGFLHYEDNYSVKDKIFTDLLIKFLKFVQEVDQDKVILHPGKGNQIGTYPLLDLYSHLNIDMSFEKKMLFIQHESQKKYARRGIGYAKDVGLTFFEEDEPFLTFEGLRFLDEHKSFFQRKFITMRDMVLKEYKELFIIIENKLWKDACVKMGSILEYGLTKWIESKKIPISLLTKKKWVKRLEDVTFEEKITYYIKTGAKKYNFELGTITEWKVVKNVIKDYRNYIHLQKYEKRINSNAFLSERDFNSVYPNFKSLIELF